MSDHGPYSDLTNFGISSSVTSLNKTSCPWQGENWPPHMHEHGNGLMHSHRAILGNRSGKGRA
jgi:hypothetical protein